MGLLAFIVVLVVLFFVARWAVRRMRFKERVQDSVQRTKERFGRLKRLIIKLFKIAVVCVIGVLTISVAYYSSLSDAERDELHRKSAERREAEATKEQATEQKERQVAREKHEDARWTAQMQKESTGSKSAMSGGTGSCYQRGVSYYRDIGSYPYLSSFPNKGRPADELINQMCSRNPSAFGG
jgi:hypothetical protein